METVTDALTQNVLEVESNSKKQTTVQWKPFYGQKVLKLMQYNALQTKTEQNSIYKTTETQVKIICVNY